MDKRQEEEQVRRNTELQWEEVAQVQPPSGDIAPVIPGDVLARCAQGFHAWVPWLAVYNDDGTLRFYTTWCCREGCDHTEQWDI